MSNYVLAFVMTALSVSPTLAQGTQVSQGASRARVIAISELSEKRPAASLAKPGGVESASANKSVSPTRTSTPSDTGLNDSAETTVSKTRPRTNAATTGSGATSSVTEKQIYRVGAGDVLDVRLVDMPTAKSSLFTVLESGMLDYPLSSGPVPVTGLTPDEIAERLRVRIKVLDNPKVVVKVREYASHSVIVTGFVFDPGVRYLRREATPFYVVLAEAQPRPEAVTATILRNGVPVIKIDLKDQTSVGTLVLAGDVIKISAPPVEPPAFFFAGGALNSPGQKNFHTGLTLTQAILASGGVNRSAGNKVSLSRQGADGRLSTTEYNLRQIQEGKTPDPRLEPGDRITVAEGR